MNPVRIRMLWRAGLLLCLSAWADAHVGDRVYPISYLSDKMLEEIRLDDGLVDEWIELIGDPSLTLSDFSEKERKAQLDPSDLDFRIWLAWNDNPVRFYLAFVGSDDAYENTHDYNVDSFFQDVIWTHDSILLTIDGDHSGGPDLPSNPTLEEREEHVGYTQSYEAICPHRQRSDSGCPDHTEEYEDVRLDGPASLRGGGRRRFRGGPVISTIELYVTPFDDWEGWDRPGEIEVSKLAIGQVIGVGIHVFDYDQSGEWAFWTPERMPFFPGPDLLLDGLLLGPDSSAPPGDDSAVESVSWARIKASLER